MLSSGCSRPVQPSLRIAVGGQAQMIYWPITLADSLGYYREGGLSVSIQDLQGGSKALEALFGGSTDVVCGFYDHTVQMAAQGRELRAFVSLLRYPGLAVTTTSPDVKTIADLKGRNVGVSAAGSSTHLFLNFVLAQNGVKPEQVSIVQVGLGSTAVAAATRNRIDAEVLTDPTVGLLTKQVSSLRILADTRDGDGVRRAFAVDTYPASVLYSTAPWLAAHREEASKLTRAIVRTLQWMHSHTAEEIRDKMPPSLRIEDAQVEIEGVRSLKNMLSEDGKLTAKDAETVKRVLGTTIEAVRIANIDLSRTYTNEFASPVQ